MKFLILCCALAAISLVGAITVECEFRDDDWGGGKYGYECFVKSINITSKNNRTITEVIGTHIGNRSNCDVVQFDSRVPILNYFPLNLENIFPNIETIVVANFGDLQELSAEDLKPFGLKLKHLFLGENSLQAIDFDLFRYNPNLELFAWYMNKIRHIDDGAFDNLPKLSNVLFLDEKCSEGRSDDRLSTLKLIKKAERNCKDSSIAKQREKIHELKYEIEKTRGLLGYELERNILSIQDVAFSLWNRTFLPPADQCYENQATVSTIEKIRSVVNQFTTLRAEQTKVWTRAKNELTFLTTKLGEYCSPSNPNCAAVRQELNYLKTAVFSAENKDARKDTNNQVRGFWEYSHPASQTFYPRSFY
jgi:hypothetical protein